MLVNVWLWKIIPSMLQEPQLKFEFLFDHVPQSYFSFLWCFLGNSLPKERMDPVLQTSIETSRSTFSCSSVTLSLFIFSGVLCFSELFFVKEPRDATALRKDIVIMDCQAQGELPIRICWLKNGSPVVESNRVYQFSNGSLFISETESRKGEKSDEGLYQCLAQNKYGAILSQKAHVTIASKFRFLLSHPLAVTALGWSFVGLSEIPVVSVTLHQASPDFPDYPDTHSWIML